MSRYRDRDYDDYDRGRYDTRPVGGSRDEDEEYSRGYRSERKRPRREYRDRDRDRDRDRADRYRDYDDRGDELDNRSRRHDKDRDGRRGEREQDRLLDGKFDEDRMVNVSQPPRTKANSTGNLGGATAGAADDDLKWWRNRKLNKKGERKDLVYDVGEQILMKVGSGDNIEHVVATIKANTEDHLQVKLEAGTLFNKVTLNEEDEPYSFNVFPPAVTKAKIEKWSSENGKLHQAPTGILGYIAIQKPVGVTKLSEVQRNVIDWYVVSALLVLLLVIVVIVVIVTG